MIAQEHNRLVIKGIRQAYCVCALVVGCPKLCPAGQRKINDHFDDRSPTSARDMVAREMRSRLVIRIRESGRRWRRDPSHWRRTSGVFRISAPSETQSGVRSTMITRAAWATALPILSKNVAALDFAPPSLVPAGNFRS